MDEKHALIFDIYRGTSHDGPGQRDTVFFKGCPLSCAWCHNPEGIYPKPQVWWNDKQCIACGLCHEACSRGANILKSSGISIDRTKCVVCGSCVEACPSEAMTMCGKELSIDVLAKELLKDKAYYDKTGGGVTASGGEAMMQYKAVASLFAVLHEHGVSTALDTCGAVPARYYDEVLPYTDLVLYDLKLIDSEQHKKSCGLGNEQILHNAKKICSELKEGKYNCSFWIRTPLIPSATATVDNMKGIARFVVEELGADSVDRWELCAFNNSCIGKYKRLEKTWEFEGVHLMTRSDVDKLQAVVLSAGFPKDKLFSTGIISE